MLGFDVHGADLATVLAVVQIRTRPVVRVIEPESRGTRREHDAAHSMCRDEWRAFLGSAIHVSGNELAMPMQLFGSIGIVAVSYTHLARNLPSRCNGAAARLRYATPRA